MHSHYAPAAGVSAQRDGLKVSQIILRIAVLPCLEVMPFLTTAELTQTDVRMLAPISGAPSYMVPFCKPCPAQPNAAQAPTPTSCSSSLVRPAHNSIAARVLAYHSSECGAVDARNQPSRDSQRTAWASPRKLMTGMTCLWTCCRNSRRQFISWGRLHTTTTRGLLWTQLKRNG